MSFTAGSDSYEIKRIISPKSDLKIIKNSVEVSGKGLRESEKKLGELLPDLNKDLIASTIIIGQGMPNKFSSFSPSGRKDLLEKLTKSDFMVEDIRQRVADRQTELNSHLREYEDSLLISRTQLTTAENDLKKKTEEFKTRTKPNFDVQISSLMESLKIIQKNYKEASDEQKTLECKLDIANQKLLSITEEKTKVSLEETTAYNAAYNKLFQEKTLLEGTIRTLQAEITKLKAVKDICPTCGQKIPGAVKPDTSKQEADLATHQKELTTLIEKIDKCVNTHKEYQKQIDTTFADELTETQSQVKQLKADIEIKKAAATKHIGEYADVSEKVSRLKYDKENWDKYYDGLQKTIQTLEETKTTLLKAIAVTELGQKDVLEHLAVVKKMETLIKRDFRGYLLANIITYIDNKAKEYSETVFGTRELNVYLDGNALDISYCGKMFDNLSGGEKQRVDLILQFAIRDMLITYFNTGSNILVLDEITDFLDKQSCAAIMNLLEKELVSTESVFIVSHHAAELELPIDSEIKVIKDENGISKII